MAVDQTAAGLTPPPAPAPPTEDVGPRGRAQSLDGAGHGPGTPGQGEALSARETHAGASETSRGVNGP
eukprot:14357295-Alexandrium_andersonii.AAC.1